ncbi:hypothetical protein B9T26_01420 [Acinetobacter sp. ANC 4169]|uniref:hypothetical protein n=1 Tax=Acinetobacter sp. ANC 4169 TaxID=1977879 RepID=UPI000A34A3F6|nr:hypothetical protein [Acinetobacter sp. ANC 4169]OTG76498.1 hypothetical protein B9T26_01420 [Acinetobacter sp. ANC 4169]
MTNLTTIKYEELFTKIHQAIAKREENPVRLKEPLDTIDKGAILMLGEYCRKHALNFQTHLEGENTFVITVEY